jgi:hypothetical protein
MWIEEDIWEWYNENKENRYKREWVYVELGLTRKEAREKVDKDIEENVSHSDDIYYHLRDKKYKK